MPFLIIFVVIPLIELLIFVAVSDVIGLGTALIFALLTAIIGGNLVRMQGLQTLAAMQTNFNKGQIPAAEIFDGFCIVAAGAMLITPGFLTDAIGFTLLVPKARVFLRNVLKKHTHFEVHSGGFRQPQDPDIIEGEFERVDPEEPRKDNAHKSLR